jgi:hypothetical protein
VVVAALVLVSFEFSAILIKKSTHKTKQISSCRSVFFWKKQQQVDPIQNCRHNVDVLEKKWMHRYK